MINMEQFFILMVHLEVQNNKDLQEPIKDIREKRRLARSKNDMEAYGAFVEELDSITNAIAQKNLGQMFEKLDAPRESLIATLGWFKNPENPM